MVLEMSGLAAGFFHFNQQQQAAAAGALRLHADTAGAAVAQ